MYQARIYRARLQPTPLRRQLSWLRWKRAEELFKPSTPHPPPKIGALSQKPLDLSRLTARTIPEIVFRKGPK
jgi:hypothetical protein